MLDSGRLSLFPITKAIEWSAYRLELLTSMKIVLVFHVSLLKLATGEPYPAQIQNALSPVVVDREKEYKVEEILNFCRRWKKLENLVSLRGYVLPDCKSAQDINRLTAIYKFHILYPEFPEQLQENE